MCVSERERYNESGLAVDLWIDYGQFAIEKATVVESQFEFPRKVFEDAIIDCGLHTTKVKTAMHSAAKSILYSRVA